jgi:hypothetical protein
MISSGPCIDTCAKSRRIETQEYTSERFCTARQVSLCSSSSVKIANHWLTTQLRNLSTTCSRTCYAKSAGDTVRLSTLGSHLRTGIASKTYGFRRLYGMLGSRCIGPASRTRTEPSIIWSLVLCFAIKGNIKEARRENMCILPIYKRVAVEIYHASILAPYDRGITALLEELEHKIGERMESQCGVIEVFDPAAGIRWKGDNSSCAALEVIAR